MSTIDPPETSDGTYRRVLSDTWTCLGRGNLHTVRQPFTIAFSLVEPLVWLILFTQVFMGVTRLPGFATESYLAFFAPTVVIQMALFAAMSSGIGLVNDMRWGVFNKLLVTPLNRGAIFLGKALSDALLIAVQAVLVLALAVMLGANVATGIVGVVGIVLIAVLFSIGFIALSNIIALVTESSQATTIGTQFIALPLLFMSTAFLPPKLLPDWIVTVSAFNPVTYGVNAARTLMLSGWTWDLLIPSISALIVFDVVFGIIAAVMMKRATDATMRQ